MATAAAAPIPIPAPAPAEIPDDGNDAEDVFAGGAVAVGEVLDTIADPGLEIAVTVAESGDEEPETVALASMADESMDQ